MKWNNSYATGNVLVDSEHKEIFVLVQKVLDATFTSRKEKIDTAINFLVNYTLKHFGHEERMMQESAYPQMSQHKTQHKNFAESVTAMKQKIEKLGDTLQVSNEINSTVVDWLVEHVMGSDMHLAAHYKEWQKNGR